MIRVDPDTGDPKEASALSIADPRTVDFETYAFDSRQRLVRVAYLLCGDTHTAEDLVQTTLAKLYLAWDRARQADSLDAYTRRILINEHHSWWRRAWRRRERSTDVLPESSVADNAAGDPALWKLVSDLPTRQRAVIVLRYYKQLSEAESPRPSGSRRERSSHRPAGHSRTCADMHTSSGGEES